MLEIGKLPNDQLQKILSHLSGPVRSEVLSKPAIGEDCAVLDFSGSLCAITTDPITGADDEIGALAVHVACNDIASAGAEPLGLMVTLLIPPHSSFEEVSLLMEQVRREAHKLGAEVIGGHTEVTDAVNRMIISITAIGKVNKDKLVTTAGAKAGDDIILTKYAGCEGTVILAYLFEEELTRALGPEKVARAKKLMNSISVVKEGLLAADFGVSSMHDVTEGGVLGAVWELCAASGLGAVVEDDKIPILDETRSICQYLGIDPLKLISSGCMLIASSDGSKLARLFQENGVPSAVIGRMTNSAECCIIKENKALKILQPESDELYKARKLRGGFGDGGSNGS